MGGAVAIADVGGVEQGVECTSVGQGVGPAKRRAEELAINGGQRPTPLK